MKITFLSALLLFLLAITSTQCALSANCTSYVVLSSKSLSTATVTYIASLSVESCETSADFSTYCSSLSAHINTLYGCSCANVFANTIQANDYLFTTWDIYQSWYMGIETGDAVTLIFVSSECVGLVEDKNAPKSYLPPTRIPYPSTVLGNPDNSKNGYQVFTDLEITNLIKNNKISTQLTASKVNTKQDLEKKFAKGITHFTGSDRASCSCSDFSWYETTLSEFYQDEMQDIAIEACEIYGNYDSYDYTVYLTKLVYDTFYEDGNVLVATTEVDYGWYFYYGWYAIFTVGCYPTLVFTNPTSCYPYSPPVILPTPTAIYSTAVTVTPQVSPSPRPSNSPYPSISPSSSVSVGCGNPPCSNHGRCSDGSCHCSSFYYGPQCQYEYCPGNCSYNGNCNGNTGECQCYYPYYGCDCSSVLYNCTCEHGTCNPLNGLCTCDPGWTGTNCTVSVACADNCNNHGRCTANETCDCFIGWTGDSCNITDLNCTKGCDNGGYCNPNTGTCSCPDPYFGPQCTWLHCGTGGTNYSCSGHGKCNYQTGSCYCDPGFSGCFCTNWSGTGTPPPIKSPYALPSLLQCGTGGSTQVCSGNGQCNHSTGSCYCDPGWHGCYCNQYTGTF